MIDDYVPQSRKAVPAARDWFGIEGYVHRGFEPVGEAFEQNFAPRLALMSAGIFLCVKHARRPRTAS